MSLGDEIRIARQKAYYTQEDLANELHVAVSTINRWELNKVKPNMKAMKMFKTFCASHGISYDTIENEWLFNSKRKNREE